MVSFMQSTTLSNVNKAQEMSSAGQTDFTQDQKMVRPQEKPEDTTYALATGESDKERLTILNEVYNPFSLSFFQSCGIKKGAAILELGCGIGLMSQALSSLVGKEGHILATDLSEKQLAVAHSLLPKGGIPNLQFQQLSALDIDALKERFDVVCARFLLIHIKNHQEIIQKIKSVLKPGGMLIIEDSTANSSLYSTPHTKGMETLHYVDKLQFEIQGSDEQYFTSLPQLLEAEGFTVSLFKKAHPKLVTPRERSMMTCISCLKDSFLSTLKVTPEEYEAMYRSVLELAQDTSVEIYYYELGQICATLRGEMG